VKPRLLDLFSGGGGAADGYSSAGWKATGVDIDPQPHYPYTFIQVDALAMLSGFFADMIGESFDAIHASPPCQPYSKGVTSRSSKWNDTRGKDEPALIEPLRQLLQETGKPYVIENVVGAPLRHPILLCGSMFGLHIPRHRLFEVYPRIPDYLVPRHPDCRGIAKRYAAERGWEYRDMSVTGKGRHAGTSERWAELLGMDRVMRQHDYKEAIPPAYTEWIGRHLIAAVAVAA
jgi:DNA (cytosine-5)-methyltransferase 1